jgi:hypothetical protein
MCLGILKLIDLVVVEFGSISGEASARTPDRETTLIQYFEAISNSKLKLNSLPTSAPASSRPD